MRDIVNATSYDITLLPASFAYISLLAAKALIKCVGLAERTGRMEETALYRSEIDVFRYVWRCAVSQEEVR
jgi:hypothetical protein